MQTTKLWEITYLIQTELFSVCFSLKLHSKNHVIYRVGEHVHTSSHEAKYNRVVSPGNLVSRLDSRRSNSSANPTQV